MNLKSVLLQEIKERRKQKKLSQADLSAALNISPDAYRKIENGKNPLSLTRLFIICQILDFSLINFFTKNDEEQVNSEVLQIENTWLNKELKHLLEEVWYLRETNHKLLRLLGENSVYFHGLSKTSD